MERISQTLRPFENREGVATRKIKTISKGAPPATSIESKTPAFKNRRLGHPTVQNQSKPRPPAWGF
jgi:hypothetical protein